MRDRVTAIGDGAPAYSLTTLDGAKVRIAPDDNSHIAEGDAFHLTQAQFLWPAQIAQAKTPALSEKATSEHERERGPRDERRA
jgi:hypothetical protein